MLIRQNIVCQFPQAALYLTQEGKQKTSRVTSANDILQREAEKGDCQPDIDATAAGVRREVVIVIPARARSTNRGRGKPDRYKNQGRRQEVESPLPQVIDVFLNPSPLQRHPKINIENVGFKSIDPRDHVVIRGPGFFKVAVMSGEL
jgi:hypothetical protein